jgi:hypothetical protein
MILTLVTNKNIGCKKLYPVNEFIIRLLYELNIIECFNLLYLPTDFEVINLLYRSSYYSNKEIACIRNVSLKTIEKQLSSLGDKILPGYILERMLRIIVGVETS